MEKHRDRFIACLLSFLFLVMPLVSGATSDPIPDAADEDRGSETAYGEAAALYEEGEYWKSLQAFEALGNYRDSVKKAASVKKQFLKGIRAGSIIRFGSYEQDGDPENGTEEIEWIVLVKQDKKLFLLSRYALDCVPYHTEPGDVTWATCSLRAWLNDTFFHTAFSEGEQARLVEAKIQTKGNARFKTKGGQTTKDRIFLLSTEEVTKYFGLKKRANKNKAACKGTPYCFEQGATPAGNGNCWWWTRSPGMRQTITAYVHYDGTVNVIGMSAQHGKYTIRPAVWVSL